MRIAAVETKAGQRTFVRTWSRPQVACSRRIGVCDGVFYHLRDGGPGVGCNAVFRIRARNGSHAGLRALLSGAGRNCRDGGRPSRQQSVQTRARAPERGLAHRAEVQPPGRDRRHRGGESFEQLCHAVPDRGL
jgi:hypothetical protein